MRPRAVIARTRSVRPPASSSTGAIRERGERGDQAAAVGARRAHLVDLAVAARDHAEAVAAAAQHHAEAGEHVAREVQLGLAGGAVGHRRGAG